jgi:hypothetical protein
VSRALGFVSLGCYLLLAFSRATEHSAALELNRNYEKICFNVHHRSDRRSVYRFLHATGNDCNFDQGGGNCQGFANSIAYSIAGKEEDHG